MIHPKIVWNYLRQDADSDADAAIVERYDGRLHSIQHRLPLGDASSDIRAPQQQTAVYAAPMQQQPGYPPQPSFPVGPPPEKPKSGFPTWLIVVLAVVGVVIVLGGTLLVLALSGMRRYLASAKSAEAKTTIASISRAASSAYERESLDITATGTPGGAHRLCGTATPVPAAIASVRGTKYMPSSAAGADFDSGTPTTGWKCLRFSMTTPFYYQYRYTQGSGYLVPSISPGANGFEVSAQGDLNGDGVLSTYAITGTPGPSDTITINPSIYTDNPFE